jgi:DNA helicase-2/ATP-dependent DNA helicase PcrA
MRTSMICLFDWGLISTKASIAMVDVNMQLTPPQLQAAHHLTGTLILLAAVGSGKTTTLSERIAVAVEAGVAPARILALTFTNRAAQRMRESLEERDAVAGRRVHIHTFHALCAWVLRTEAKRLGLPPEVWIHDEEDAMAVLGELGDLGMKPKEAMYKIHKDMSQVQLGTASVANYHTAAFSERPWARRYIDALTERGAVDFAGLVYLARAALAEPDCAARWAARFDLVQIDEVQDTHLSEYDVIRHLAAKAQSLCLVGDLDQTIYGWRGSRPRALLKQVAADFGPVREIAMADNFRSTKALITTANTVAEALDQRATRVVAHPDLPDGVPPTITAYHNQDAEALGVATRAQAIIDAGTPPDRIAVLCRNNWTTARLANALVDNSVPAATIERFQYFRRREVKDAMALLKLVVDRDAPAAIQRIAIGFVRNLGATTLDKIRTEGADVGLRLVDMVDSCAIANGDPLWGLFADDCVVLDTETTGVDPQSDEVIEVAAVRMHRGQEVDHFEALIQPSKAVGDSEAVHHLSDALLAAEGAPPEQVFKAFRAFCGALPVVGHNVRFDLRMLAAHGERVGVEMAFDAHFDTLRYARRLLRADSYRLGDLAKTLQLTADPTHRALADVRTTVQLLQALTELGMRGRSVRERLIREIAPKFQKLRLTLDAWAALGERPHVLMARMLDEGRILAHFQRHRSHKGTDRAHNLAQLPARLARLDDARLAPVEAIRQVLDRAALSREQDLLDELPGVRVLTIHQSKGLEFDAVLVPELVDGVFPTRGAIQSDDLQEERRVFYVAVTRARRELHLSWPMVGRWGPTTPSRFLDGLT